MTAADAATEAVAEVAEEVADQAYSLADASREVSRRGLGFTIGAFLVGAGVGGGLAYLLTSRRLETKYSTIADNEIAEMREHYQNKILALEATAGKEDLEDIVAERGYTSPDSKSSTPPMAVAPPERVVDAAREAVIEAEDDAAGEPPDVEEEPEGEPEVRNIFTDADVEANVTEAWDYEREIRHRSPEVPYIIHYDERDEFEDYQPVTLTYYEADDVLCNERDEIIAPEERNAYVGEKSLERFGHGSNDPSIVYVRNDKMELLLEIVKSPNSYAEEVHGFQHDGYGRNLERMRAREREELDDT